MPTVTLSTRIALLAGLLSLAGAAVLSAFLVSSSRQQVFEELTHASESLAEVVRLSITREMQLNNPEGIREIIGLLGEHQGIERIRIYNKEGRIVHSNEPGELGRVVDKGAEACFRCHDDSSPLRHVPEGGRTRTFRGPDGRELLATILVIPNEPSCHAAGCHGDPAEKSVLGVLDVAVSIDAAEARLSASTWRAALVSAVAGIAISGALLLIVGYSVRRPVARLIRASRSVAAGDYALRVPAVQTDEIGFLARAFNEMLESVDHSHQALEDKLSKRAEELRQAQAQVIRAEKLSSVGVIAAGVAHELNSPLMAIITFAHLLRDKQPEGSQERQDLELILREANRCAAIIRDLLDFARGQKTDAPFAPCAPGPLAQRALDMLRPQSRERGVEASIEVKAGLPEVEGDPAQLTQVFINLALNAIQAMPKGGRLRVLVDEVGPEALAGRKPPRLAARWLRLRVQDTGGGIKTEDLERVFDPFFTTKPAGQGSGLGLSVSHGIVTRHGGLILVASDGRTGAEFTVLLPVPPAPATPGGTKS